MNRLTEKLLVGSLNAWRAVRHPRIYDAAGKKKYTAREFAVAARLELPKSWAEKTDHLRYLELASNNQAELKLEIARALINYVDSLGVFTLGLSGKIKVQKLEMVREWGNAFKPGKISFTAFFTSNARITLPENTEHFYASNLRWPLTNF